MTCPHCGGKLSINENQTKATCDYCDSVILLKEEKEFDNANHFENLGYEFEKGRQRAKQEAFQQNASVNYGQNVYVKKKRHTFWWVMGWIFIFPIPITIIISRNKTMKTWLKTGIIALSWFVYLLIGFINQ